jgi:hypothetical protein
MPQVGDTLNPSPISREAVHHFHHDMKITLHKWPFRIPTLTAESLLLCNQRGLIKFEIARQFEQIKHPPTAQLEEVMTVAYSRTKPEESHRAVHFTAGVVIVEFPMSHILWHQWRERVTRVFSVAAEKQLQVYRKSYRANYVTSVARKLQAAKSHGG